MTTTTWTAKRAWEHLATVVLQEPETLPHFSYATGLEDIDDFMYLERSDFETSFEVGIMDSTGATVPSSQTLPRVLIGKLIRAQRWSDEPH